MNTIERACDVLNDAAKIDAPEVISGAVYFSGPEDVEEVFAFYETDKHEHVDDRDPAQLEQETVSGRLLLIRSEGNIVAASSAFNYSVDKQEPQSWVEIGATRVKMGGFGFYPFIIASQTLQECFDGTPEDYIFANIYADNAAVQHLLGVKTGWDNFSVADDPALERAYSRKNGVSPEEMNTWAWLKSGPNCLPHQAQVVEAVLEQQHFMNLKDPERPKKLDLDMSGFSLALPEGRRKIALLARGEFSDFLVRGGDNLTCQEVSEALETGNTQELISRFEM